VWLFTRIMSNEEIGWEDSLGDIVSPGDLIAG
jgi:hypothetical protein